MKNAGTEAGPVRIFVNFHGIFMGDITNDDYI